MDQQRYDRGMRCRREVLGDEYVDRALEGAGDFGREFQEMLTEYGWGGTWARGVLDRQRRSILNLGMLAALGKMPEFEIHLRGALRNGLSRAELHEVLLQIAVYCGLPAGVECFRAAMRVFGETQDPEPPGGG